MKYQSLWKMNEWNGKKKWRFEASKTKMSCVRALNALLLIKYRWILWIIVCVELFGCAMSSSPQQRCHSIAWELLFMRWKRNISYTHAENYFDTTFLTWWLLLERWQWKPSDGLSFPGNVSYILIVSQSCSSLFAFSFLWSRQTDGFYLWIEFNEGESVSIRFEILSSFYASIFMLCLVCWFIFLKRCCYLTFYVSYIFTAQRNNIIENVSELFKCNLCASNFNRCLNVDEPNEYGPVKMAYFIAWFTIWLKMKCAQCTTKAAIQNLLVGQMVI